MKYLIHEKIYTENIGVEAIPTLIPNINLIIESNSCLTNRFKIKIQEYTYFPPLMGRLRSPMQTNDSLKDF